MERLEKHIVVELNIVKRTETYLLRCMGKHYSQPKGFVGRSICYAVNFNDTCYGFIVGGSATLHLVGRNDFIGEKQIPLNNIVNNIFFHCEKISNKYPIRNFMPFVLKTWREKISEDWLAKYGDVVLLFESLVEKPRTGDTYLRDNWQLVGETKGYTCKRVSGKSTDSWTGRRIWNYADLRPKLVFMRWP